MSETKQQLEYFIQLANGRLGNKVPFENDRSARGKLYGRPGCFAYAVAQVRNGGAK